jgi:hypothetical protein
MAITSDLHSRTRPTKPSAAKKPTSLPQETVDYLKAWMMSPEHIAHPYPTEQEKAEIMAETGIELKQLTNWFVNNRKRYWKPRIEAKITAEGGGSVIPPTENAMALSLAVRRGEDPHTVSEGGSVVSSSSANTPEWCSEEEDSPQQFQPVSIRNALMPQHARDGSIRREVVDLHVLLPETKEEGKDALPTLRDVTIRTNVKKEMILATFPKCLLQYSVPDEIEGDRKKIQTRRDGEVLRVKKHYLKLYLATRGIHSCSSPYGENPIDVSIANSTSASSNSSVSSASNKASKEECDTVEQVNTSFSLKRPVTLDDIQDQPAPRRRRVSSATMNGDEEWRSICQNARDIFCDSLPGLEEAAIMFGYVSQ